MAEFRSVGTVFGGVEENLSTGITSLRFLPLPGLKRADPYITFQKIGPLSRDSSIAAHPHRGFQHITLVLNGVLHHSDNSGESMQFAPGEVHWMRAGAGIIHREHLAVDRHSHNKIFAALQLWVNLPSRLKMTAPWSRKITSAEIPVIESTEGHVRTKVIAGDCRGYRGPIKMPTPLLMVMVNFSASGETTIPVPPEFSACCFVLSGSAQMSCHTYPAIHGGNMVVFRNNGNAISLGGTPGTELLVMAGRPINEPVAVNGPFVMNGFHELHQALNDYRSGRMGSLYF